MQLHDCLQLAVSRSPIGVTRAMLSFDRESGDFLLPHVSITGSQDDGESQRRAQGPIISTLKCIVTEWGSSAQTNFYIPPERYAGYSYLEDHGQSGRNSQHGTDTYSHGHHHHAFVYAEESSNLHPHHYEVYNIMRGNSPNTPKVTVTSYSSFNLTRPQGDTIHGRWPYHGQSSVLSSHMRTFNLSILHSQMTIPYIHPQLKIPVPPLHLPWFYGALCWSFALAGLVMLNMPQKWILDGGGRGNLGRQEHYRRHWFPYRVFAWVLIVWQVRLFSFCTFSLLRF
jgi:hypothetical protein